MTRRRTPGPSGDRVDVHRVDVHRVDVHRVDVYRLVQDEALLTRLAHQQPGLLPDDLASSRPDLSAPTVESFLADWRARTVSPELPPPPSAKAIQRAARAAGLSAPARSNSFRAAVGIVASVAFLLSGTAIAGARSARPGDVLWPVTRTFWADRAEATMARHDIDVALGRAAAALAAGDRDGADQALMVAAAALPRIPEDARGALQLRMQQVGAGMDASPAPAAQAAQPAGTPQAVPGPQARPGVPVVPVAASSTGGGSPTPPNAQEPGIGVPGDQDADTSRSAPWMPGQGSTSPVSPEPAATEPAATEPESTQDRATLPGSPAGNGSAPTAGSSLSIPPTTGSSPEQTSTVSTSAVASIPSDSTGPTPQPSTSADATSAPSTTAPSTAPTTASPTAPSTGSSTASSTASPTGTTDPGDTTAPTTSSADSVSADAVPTSATPSRRTTRPPPGFAPPPLTTPASPTSATETAMETGSVETTAATVAR